MHISRRELPHKLFKETLTELIQQTLIERAHFTWNGYFYGVYISQLICFTRVFQM